MADTLSILCVGTDLDLASEYASWADEYNIKDHNWVFFDYHKLEKKTRNSSVEDEFGRSWNRPNSSNIMTSLKNGNTVVVLLPNKSTISPDSGTELPVTRDWPVEFNLIEESGKTIDLETVHEEYEWYFQNRNFNWHVRINGSKGLEGLSHHEYRSQSLVENLSGESLGVLYQVEPEYRDLVGTLAFVPVGDDWRRNELMSEMLSRFTDIQYNVDVDSAPDWIREYDFPGEDQANEELNKLEQQKERIEAEIAECEKELEEYDRYKALLHGNEDSLEILVPEVFENMGFDIDGEERHHRDAVLHLDDIHLVMEITGTSGGIQRDKCRQLDDWVRDYELGEKGQEEEYSGVLVVNPKKNIRPDLRNEDEYLPPHIERFLKTRDWQLLLTPDLYEIFTEYEEGNLSHDDIQDLFSEREFKISLE